MTNFVFEEDILPYFQKSVDKSEENISKFYKQYEDALREYMFGNSNTLLTVYGISLTGLIFLLNSHNL